MAKLSPDYIRWTLTLNAEQARQEYHKLGKDIDALNKSNAEAQKRLKELEATGGKGSAEWKRLTKEVEANNKAIDNNQKRMGELRKQFDQSKMSMAELRKHLKSLKRELDNTARATNPERYRQLQDSIRQCEAAMRNVSGETQKTSKAFGLLTKAGAAVSGFFGGLAAMLVNEVVGAFRGMVSTIMDFSAENSKLAAILGTTKQGIGALTEQARELGRTTAATASQVTQLQIELAKLGFTQDQILKMTPGVLRFAKTVGTDLGSAASFAGAALRIFDKDADQTNDVLATLAVSTTKSALDFNKLQSSLATIGPVAAAYGLTLEDTTALLGVLANAGFDASSAATATRNILLNLCDANGKLAKALGQPAHNLDELVAGMQTLTAKGVDLGAVLEMTDKRSVAAFASMLSASNDLLVLRDSITDVTDDFAEMSKTMADNAKAAQAGFGSAIEGLLLRFGGLDNVMRNLYNAGTEIVNMFGDLVDALRPLMPVIKEAVDNIFGLVKHIIDLVKGVVNLVNKVPLLTRAFKAFSDVSTKILSDLDKLFGVISSWLPKTKEVAKATDLLAESQERQRKATEDVATAIDKERQRLEKLRKIAANEGETKQRRLEAIEKLNRAIPGYITNLDTESLKYKENKQRLDDYIKSLERKLRLEANQEEYKRLIKEDEETRRRSFDEYTRYQRERSHHNNMRRAIDPNHSTLEDRDYSYDNFDDWYAAQNTGTSRALKDYRAHMGIMGFSEAELLGAETGDKTTTTTGKTKKPKHTPGTYNDDSIDKVKKPIESRHKNALIAINAHKGEIADADIAIQQARELIRYCVELEEALNKLAAKTDKTHTATLDKIQAEQDKLREQSEGAYRALDAAQAAYDKDNHSRQMQAIEAYHAAYAAEQQRMVGEGLISQQEGDLLMLTDKKAHYADMIAQLNKYRQTTQNATYLGAEEQRKALAEIDKQIADAQNKMLTQAGKVAQTIRLLATDTTSLAGMAKAYEARRAQMVHFYDTAIAKAKEAGLDTVALEQAKNRQLSDLDYQRLQQIYAQKEQVGLTWADEYARELAELKHLHEQGLISEKQYQEKRLRIGVANAQKYFSYYSQVGGAMFTALQQAEIAQSDAKYDVLIQQAKNNGQETTAIEEEKEAAKLDIQKKYADVNFAVKVSEIIANTAVAIMQAFAQLGPIGGAIAAAMLTATGAAQAAAAAAEREKIKKLQPGKSASTDNSDGIKQSTVTRSLTGYAEGGYTGDGDRYEVAGIVHRGEYVVPKPIMHDPAVVDAVGTIEAIRRNRAVAAGTARTYGYASGGAVDSASTQMLDVSDFRAAIDEFRWAATHLHADVSLRSLKSAEAADARAKSPFTRSAK